MLTIFFSRVFNKLNKLVNKHASLVPPSKRKAKHVSKPWITSRELFKTIRVKNALFVSGDVDKYKLYRKKLVTLIKHGKKLYYYAYFNDNLRNIQNTWPGINELINGKTKNSKPLVALKNPGSDKISCNPSELPNIINSYNSSAGKNLACKVPQSKPF